VQFTKKVERKIAQNVNKRHATQHCVGVWPSQAARQGLAVGSAVVVLQHETSTLRQSHNFISIDMTFGVGDNVRDVTSPAKFG